MDRHRVPACPAPFFIALNLGIVVYGFALFFLSSLLWGSVALVQREPSLAVLQGAFTAINVLGLWRWAGS
jgi:hypothetical protein